MRKQQGPKNNFPSSFAVLLPMVPTSNLENKPRRSHVIFPPQCLSIIPLTPREVPSQRKSENQSAPKFILQHSEDQPPLPRKSIFVPTRYKLQTICNLSEVTLRISRAYIWFQNSGFFTRQAGRSLYELTETHSTTDRYQSFSLSLIEGPHHSLGLFHPYSSW